MNTTRQDLIGCHQHQPYAIDNAEKKNQFLQSAPTNPIHSMELTPIKIRGKRRSKAPKVSQPSLNLANVALAASSRGSTPSTTSSKRSSSNGPNPKLGKRRKLKALNLSELEKLPAELLQSIFFYCMNISLPRASLPLAKKLSSKHLCMMFTIRALNHGLLTDADHEPEIMIPNPSLPLPRLAADLLSCRFFTWQFYRKYTQKVFEIYQARLEAHQDIVYRDPLKINEDHQSLAEPFSASLIPSYLKPQSIISLPPKLLHGPWTDDKINLLYILVWTGATIDWDRSTAGETATQGLIDAIREDKAIPVACLLQGVFHGVSPTTEELRIAVMESGCNRTIVNHLLLKALQDLECQGMEDKFLETKVDIHDPELWGWAERDIKSGGNDGSWLLTRLRQVDVLERTFTLNRSTVASSPSYATEFMESESSYDGKLIPLKLMYS